MFEGKRIGVFIAHPDDELLWCGNTIYTISADWYICVCSDPRVRRVDYESRIDEFYKVAEMLGVKECCIIEGAPDSLDYNYLKKHRIYKDAILRELEKHLPLDVIITHDFTNKKEHHGQHVFVGETVYDFAKNNNICLYVININYDGSLIVNGELFLYKTNYKENIADIYITGSKGKKIKQYGAFNCGYESFRRIK